MWNQRYDTPEYVYGTRPAGFVERTARHLAPGSQVLCVADGEGRNSVFLAGQGHAVTAFDLSENALEKAKRLAEGQGAEVDFHRATIEEWDWEVPAWDAIVAICIQFLPPPERARLFEGFSRVLRPGGLLLLHGYAPRQVENGTGGPPVPEFLYTLDLLESAFAGWEILESADYDAVLDDGPGHSGPSALVDFVARKPSAGAG